MEKKPWKDGRHLQWGTTSWLYNTHNKGMSWDFEKKQDFINFKSLFPYPAKNRISDFTEEEYDTRLTTLPDVSHDTGNRLQSYESVQAQWRGHFKSYVQSLPLLKIISKCFSVHKSGACLQDNWLTFCEGTLQLPQQQGDVLNTPNGKHFHSLHWKELLHFHWKCKVISEPQELLIYVTPHLISVKWL